MLFFSKTIKFNVTTSLNLIEKPNIYIYIYIFIYKTEIFNFLLISPELATSLSFF